MNNAEQEIIRVFLVEDHALVRRMLGKLLRRTSDLALCGEAPSAEAALTEIPTCQPRVVLVDVFLPGMDGITLIRLLRERHPEVLTLAVSGHKENLYALRALQAGARGYVMKDDLMEVVEAIRHVHNGGVHVSEKVQAMLDSPR